MKLYRFIRRSIVELADTLTAVLCPIFGYTIRARYASGKLATHYAWTRADAMQWACLYWPDQSVTVFDGSLELFSRYPLVKG